MNISEKLKLNYGKTVIVIRLLFVVSFIFANIYNLLGVGNLLKQTMDINGAALLISVLISAMLTALLISLIVRPILGVILGLAKIYYLPVYEVSAVALLCMTLSNGILAILNATFFITPVIVPWGLILFSFISSTITVLLFFKIMKKNYLNSTNAPYFFKVTSICYFIYFGIQLAINIYAGV